MKNISAHLFLLDHYKKYFLLHVVNLICKFWIKKNGNIALVSSICFLYSNCIKVYVVACWALNTFNPTHRGGCVYLQVYHVQLCVTLLGFRSILRCCMVLCVSMCHYYHSLPWWSWGVHSGCFLWWRASKSSLEEYTPASGSTSSPVRTSHTQTWGLPSDTSHSCPSAHSTYTGGLVRTRRREGHKMK